MPLDYWDEILDPFKLRSCILRSLEFLNADRGKFRSSRFVLLNKVVKMIEEILLRSNGFNVYNTHFPFNSEEKDSVNKLVNWTGFSPLVEEIDSTGIGADSGNSDSMAADRK